VQQSSSQPDQADRPGAARRSLLPACALLLLGAAALLLLLRHELPAAAGPLLVLGLAVALALGGLVQAVALRRLRARLAALEAGAGPAARELVAAKEAAESSSRAKSEFLANMTHEVRTPLNGILGMLQVLLGTEISPAQREFAVVALESAERLNGLLNNVIDFARLESDMSRADCLEFPLTDLLRSLEARFAARAGERGVAFAVSAEPGLPELLLADPQALGQALAHLLDNALKFTPAGSVRLEAGPDRPDWIRIRVADTGIGIPADQRERVFEAFAQADASVTRTYGGAGLGLAIARRLVRRMGGDLVADARPGGGTVMTLTLPVDCGPHLPA
jgi:signal transduction histidine kinase